MTCTFFGHADAPEEVKEKLTEVIVNLIRKKGVDTFYVGTHGNFDKMAYNVLLRLSEAYKIKLYVVLSAVPLKDTPAYKNAIVPEGIENVPVRFGIEYRNRWMVMHADYVVTYVKRCFGGAYKFEEYAKKKKKLIISI